jgi:hypothetical protein
MSPIKVQSIQDWAEPRSVKNVQQFLGFANFYRRFIDGFSEVARPLTELTKKDAKAAFNWSETAGSAFATLKRLFTAAPILVHFHPQKPTVVETDASDFALGAVISQIQETKRLHPVAYHSRKFKPAEINYDVHDKEMLAIVTAFKEWEHMLNSVADEITVYTDHKNLEYFATSKVLTRRQARWSEHLAEFNFKVIYRPGEKNTKADVLSRCWDYAPKEGGEASPVSFFKTGQYVASAVSGTPETVHGVFEDTADGIVVLSSIAIAANAAKEIELSTTFLDLIRAAAEKDPEWQATKEAILRKDENVAEEFEVKEGLLYYENRWPSAKKDPVRTQASVGLVACMEAPWTAWEAWERARSKQPACAHYPRRVSPAIGNAQMSIFQECAPGRRMASQEWQKSKPTCNEHS